MSGFLSGFLPGFIIGVLLADGLVAWGDRNWHQVGLRALCVAVTMRLGGLL